MKFLILISILVLPYIMVAHDFSKSEKQQLDSLNKIIEDPKSHDTSIVFAYLYLSEILYIAYPDTDIYICNKAKQIAENALKNNPNKEEKLKLMEGLSNLLNGLGYYYKLHGNNVKAIELYHKALRINEDIGNKDGVAVLLINMGYIYFTQGDTLKALDNYNRALKIALEDKNESRASYAYNSLGFIKSLQKKHDEALVNYNKALAIRIKLNESEGLIATLTNNIGQIHRAKGDYISALASFEKSLMLYEQAGDPSGKALCLNNIATLEYESGSIKKAEIYSNMSLKISKDIGFPNRIMSSSKLLTDIYEKQGNNKQALEMYKLYIQMRDSINNESTQKAAVQQQAKYEYEKQKAVDDAEHDKQIAIEQEAKEKQTILTYATAGGLGLVGIFLIFVFNRLQVTRKQKRVIEQQKAEVEKQKYVVEKAHSELEEKNKEITDSIQYAKRIQNAILPPSKVVKEYLQESFIYYKPKDIVAGDFYWLEHKNEQVLFAAADCTGHGVPGAMVSVVCNNGLNRSVREYGLTDPGEILNKTREIVVQEFEKSEDEVKDGMDIALCSLQLQATNNKQQTTAASLQYAGANNPLWIIRDGEVLETKADKQPIGQFDNPEPYTTHTIELQKGDSLYIFSDGYADQFGGEKGKKLKTANFKKLLLSIQNESMDKQKQLINTAFEDWKGELEQLDDVCVIGVRI